LLEAASTDENAPQVHNSPRERRLAREVALAVALRRTRTVNRWSGKRLRLPQVACKAAGAHQLALERILDLVVTDLLDEAGYLVHALEVFPHVSSDSPPVAVAPGEEGKRSQIPPLFGQRSSRREEGLRFALLENPAVRVCQE